MIRPLLMRLAATDTSRQKRAIVPRAPTDATVGELIEGLLPQMNLPRFDSSGRPLAYHALLDRQGRHLHASEVLGEALEQDDELVIQPDVDAGGSEAVGR